MHLSFSRWTLSRQESCLTEIVSFDSTREHKLCWWTTNKSLIQNFLHQKWKAWSLRLDYSLQEPTHKQESLLKSRKKTLSKKISFKTHSPHALSVMSNLSLKTRSLHAPQDTWFTTNVSKRRTFQALKYQWQRYQTVMTVKILSTSTDRRSCWSLQNKRDHS